MKKENLSSCLISLEDKELKEKNNYIIISSLDRIEIENTLKEYSGLALVNENEMDLISFEENLESDKRIFFRKIEDFVSCVYNFINDDKIGIHSTMDYIINDSIYVDIENVYEDNNTLILPLVTNDDNDIITKIVMEKPDFFKDRKYKNLKGVLSNKEIASAIVFKEFNRSMNNFEFGMLFTISELKHYCYNIEIKNIKK